MKKDFCSGDFTLPGEAGYEQLTLELARRWGADVIRDSDGTKLSDEIVDAGYRIYSTICIIREHNAFAKAHPDAQQQTFLCSDAVLATGDGPLAIDPLAGYFDGQFALNDSPDAMRYWQVWDRTANAPVGADGWRFESGRVIVEKPAAWHRYTASFLCWRVWEEINMYNHTTNSWTSEHLMQLDPRHPLAWEYLQKWLDDWCRDNPQTDVIRLTSLFYNFVWIFGSDMRRRSRFVDWASYDFTVSPAALDAFEAEYGYALTAEDFINQGRLQATHRPPTAHKRDYMDFIQRFVAKKAKALVEIIHRHGKQAYVFYDDSWVGMEPSGKYFAGIGFDGLIKCVFSGFECRLCADAKAPVHELRFHPYLFPVGLGGLPTFSEGGHPEKDAMEYWLHVRRALVREPVDRIGLGGYLHLTREYPAFVDAIEKMAVEFRRLKALHADGAPSALPITVAVLHTWGSLRPWTLSGHFHETYENVLIHINEALSGLPVNVRFISFEDVEKGALEGVDAVINAGRAGDAWSGGEAWKSDALTEALTRFVHEGGAFIGVGEPSAFPGYDTVFRMAHVLGVDGDHGEYACHARWELGVDEAPFAIVGDALGAAGGARVISPDTRILDMKDGAPRLTLHEYGSGRGVYLSGFEYSPRAARMLLEILMTATGRDASGIAIADDPMVEAGWFPASRTLVLLNNAPEPVRTRVRLPGGETGIALEAFEMKILNED